MQTPQAEVWHPVWRNPAQRITRGPVSIVLSGHTLGDHSERVPCLGLERMLNLMHGHFVWPQMALQAKEHIEKCCQCITLKVKQQWAPMENVMATHPLKLLHINYLCLEPGKGKEENLLVVMDHFTCYSQVYVT